MSGPLRAFPVVYAADVAASRAFYERLGFETHFSFPPGDAPGYVGLRRGDSELGITAADFPRQTLGVEVGGGPRRSELFVYVDGVTATVESLRAAGVTVLAEPADMPWGERLAYVADPDGNPVALAE